MKKLLIMPSFVVLLLLSVSVGYAESSQEVLRKGKGPLPSGTIRQEPLPDLFGHPVTKYTSDNGTTSVIRQKPFPDLLGNPVYDVKQEKRDEAM